MTAETYSTIAVSFIIPVHNSEGTLLRALDSVFAQTVKEIEVIAVNDASEDSSKKILAEYAEKEARLRIIDFAENKGTMTARRRGIEAAAGKYLLFLDPDDEFLPDGVEQLLKTAEKYQADMVHFDLQEYRDGKRVWNWCPAKPGWIAGELAVVRDLLKDHGHYWNLCLKMIRRDLFLPALTDVEDFHCIMCEDLYMDLAVELRAGNIFKTSFAPYIYHTGCGVTADQKRSLDSFRKLFSSLRALALSKAMLPEEFHAAMDEITLKQCRILLTRCHHDLTAEDREKALAELRQDPWCPEAMTLAETLPLLAGANTEDFLNGHPVLRKLLDFVLPPGTRRRLYFKTKIKRLLKKG